MEHDIMKALEVWTLQTLLNVSILLGILAAGLALIQGYYRALEKQAHAAGIHRNLEGLHGPGRGYPPDVGGLDRTAGAESRHNVRHQNGGALLPGGHGPVRPGLVPAIVPRGPRGRVAELLSGVVAHGCGKPRQSGRLLAGNGGCQRGVPGGASHELRLLDVPPHAPALPTPIPAVWRWRNTRFTSVSRCCWPCWPGAAGRPCGRSERACTILESKPWAGIGR